MDAEDARLDAQKATFEQVQRGKKPLFENTLGMRLVPVPRTAILFSTWETRVKSYRAFA